MIKSKFTTIIVSSLAALTLLMTGCQLPAEGEVMIPGLEDALDHDKRRAEARAISEGGTQREQHMDSEGPYRLDYVVDGDTINIILDGASQRVRLIGIDTPETKHPQRGQECYGQEATINAQQVLSGGIVFLETDPTQDLYDNYDRLLAYVWNDAGVMLNSEQLKNGFATEYTYNTAYRYQDDFRAAEAEAENDDRGLWGAC